MRRSLSQPVSLTARLAILFATLSAGLLVIAGIFFGRMLETHFQELDVHELQGKLTLIRTALQGDGLPSASSGRMAALENSFVGHDNVGVLLRALDGRVLEVIHPEHFTPEQLSSEQLAPEQLGASHPPQAVSSWEVDGRPHRGLAARITLPQHPTDVGAPDTVDVLVALDLSHHTHFLASVRNATWAGVAIAAFLAALVGWFAAHRGLAPLRRVTATASALSAQQLGQRLNENDAPREVREHVEAFNGMLERLEAAFQRLADYSADIAHELRTPISNLMTQTQVALSRPRSNDEYQDILASNIEEYERIARMVSDMLFLAKAEQNALAQASAPIDLACEADALIDFYEALAEEHRIRIERHGTAVVAGDRLMLRRALSNLLSNALRHTPDGGQITIAIDIAADGAALGLSVSNVGDPIAPDQLERIFDRFHRGSSLRERHGEGAGLGLAITRLIAQAHGGEVVARSNAGTTTFTISLPLRQAPSGT